VGAVLITLLGLNLGFYLPARLRQMTGLYDMRRADGQPLEALGLDRALVIVHPQTAWTEYGALLRLTPPFADNDLLLAYTRGAETDAQLARAYPDRPVYHYYPGAPPRLVAVER
jgi:hypothetical protein